MQPDRITGRLWKFEDNVNTDVIFPGKYTYTLQDPEEIASHALEDLNPRFAKEVKQDDILVAGSNWGCGSSREQAVSCLVFSGVSAIIAKSFSRIYFRNALNNGLPVIECPEFVDQATEGEIATISFSHSMIYYPSLNAEFRFSPFSPDVMRILDAGGLIPFVRQSLSKADYPSCK